MPLGLGPWELAIILIIVIIIFGVGKLPQIGGAIGKSIKEFKTATDEEPEKTIETKVQTSVKSEATEQTEKI